MTMIIFEMNTFMFSTNTFIFTRAIQSVYRFVSKLQNQIEGKDKSAIAKLLIFLLDHGLVSSVEKQLFLDKRVQSIQDDISDDLKAELDARM